MNLLWGWMLAAGIIYGTLTGNMSAVTQAVLDGAADAVSLAITMAGMMAFWCGIMQIGQSGGLIDAAVRGIEPLLKWLFPHIPSGHPARDSIAVNCIANVFGLGSAATPAGLKAIGELAVLEEERRQPGNHSLRLGHRPVAPGTASDEMCTFLVLNISSLQLIPVNIIAYRAQYGSASPTAVVGPAILATAVSTAVGILFCKIMCANRRGRL